MKEPLLYRKGIPFFSEKSEKDFQSDAYERYDPMVLRQIAIHLSDTLWGNYPMQTIMDFINKNIEGFHPDKILEIGCGIGRVIATLAQNHQESTCWGVDYSYQMLKQANDFWKLEKDVLLDLTNKGFQQKHTLKGYHLNNLHFGLAKANSLPFENESQDLILNNFLIDRLDHPSKSLLEMHRVLKKDGKIIVVSPLNFNRSKHWEALFPTIKIQNLLLKIGFKILKWKDEIRIQEPLDVRKNMITWNCLGIVASKDK